MSTESILPIAGGSSGSDSPPPVNTPGALLDRDAFLTLLVTQLKYQDPANPADTSQLLTQSAQLTMVDRLNEIAESISGAASIDRMTLAGTMIGRDVSFRTDDGSIRSDRVTAVRFDAGELTVVAGPYDVPLDAIVELAAPSDPAAGAGSLPGDHTH